MTPKETDAVNGEPASKATQESPSSESPFQRFEEFARRIISVPKADIDERERAYKGSRKKG